MQLLEAYYRDGYVTDPSVPSRIAPGDKRHVITGAQPKAGTGLKMQTVSVFFSTLHC